MTVIFLVFLFALTILSWFLTRRYLFFAVKNHLVDRPNIRSSHVKITARGGGVPFVVLYCLYLVVALFIYDEWFFTLTLLLGGFIVALIGFLDDKYNLTARVRIIFHMTSALIILWGLGGVPNLVVFGIPLSLGFLGVILGVFFLVWFLNLYNFMDGINGLAGLQAVFFLSGYSLLVFLYFSGPFYPLSIIVKPSFSLLVYTFFLPLLMLPLVALIMGFLAFNFPYARVFMGDAGSGFLGVVIAFFILVAGKAHESFFWAGLILMGIFVVDATWTLCVRLIQRQKIFSPHCLHAYQITSRKLRSHTKTTLWAMAINVVWLFPMATLVVFKQIDGAFVLIVAYVPLLLICYLSRAGSSDAV